MNLTLTVVIAYTLGLLISGIMLYHSAAPKLQAIIEVMK